MATEEQVAQSSSVTGLAAAALGRTAGQVQAALSVDSPQDTQVLNVRYTAPDPADAARGAQTVAEKYLEFRSTSTAKDAERRIDDLNVAISADESKLRANAGAETGPLQGDLQSLLAARRQLIAIESTPVGRVITAASVPTSPSSPRLATDVPVGLAAGLLVGLALALLLPTPEGRRTTAPVRTPAPRRARDAGGKPSEFDRMLLAAQTTGKAGAAPSAAGPLTAPLLVASPAGGSAGGTGANGVNGAPPLVPSNGAPVGNGAAAAGVAPTVEGANGAVANGAGAPSASGAAQSSSRS
jgi:hypothetical protein